LGAAARTLGRTARRRRRGGHLAPASSLFSFPSPPLAGYRNLQLGRSARGGDVLPRGFFR